MNRKIKTIKRKYFKDDDFYIIPKNNYGDMYLVYLANTLKEDDPELYDMLLKDSKEAMKDFLEYISEEDTRNIKCMLTAKINALSFNECDDILKLIRFSEWKKGI